MKFTASVPRCLASTVAPPPRFVVRAVPTATAFAGIPDVEPSKLDLKLDAALTALSAIGSEALAARTTVSVDSYAPAKGQTAAAAAVAAVDGSGSLAQTSTAPAYGARQRVIVSSIGMHAIDVRKTLAVFVWQLMRAALPAKMVASMTAGGRQVTHEDMITISKELNAAGKRKETLAILAVALCYIDGVGLFSKSRDRAREMLEQLRVRFPTFAWPSLCHALLLLLEVQDRIPPAGPGSGPTDLAYAPAAFRSHPDCTAAVSILEECWTKHRLAPAPFLLARVHLHGIGDSEGSRDVDMALRWLCVGATAGDPSCCVELARFLIWVRESLPGGVAAAEAAVAARAAAGSASDSPSSALSDAAKAAGAGATSRAASAAVYHLDTSPPGSAAAEAAPGAPGAPNAPSTAPAGAAPSPSLTPAAVAAARGPESLSAGVDRAILTCLKYASVCGNLQAREWLQHEYRRAGLVKLAALWEVPDDMSPTQAAGAAISAAAGAAAAAGSASAAGGMDASLPGPAEAAVPVPVPGARAGTAGPSGSGAHFAKVGSKRKA